MKLVLNCYSGTIFYESENTSKESHDGYFVYKFVNKATELQENCVVQVVTDNANNNVSAVKLLEVACPHNFWSTL